MPPEEPPRSGRARSRAAGSPARPEEQPAGQVDVRDDDALRLRDPREIRALAHPARMAIIDALASGEELTATECARLTGLSPSATAYHLKFLERYRFAEPAPARNDGRERPWRASARRTSFELDTSTAAGSAAATAVGVAFFDHTRALAEEFMATAHEEPEEWQQVALLANTDLWVTVEEAATLHATLVAALESYGERSADDRPDGSRRVRVMNLIAPHRSSGT